MSDPAAAYDILNKALIVLFWFIFNSHYFFLDNSDTSKELKHAQISSFLQIILRQIVTNEWIADAPM